MRGFINNPFVFPLSLSWSLSVKKKFRVFFSGFCVIIHVFFKYKTPFVWEFTLGKIYEHVHLKDLADLEFEHNLLKKFDLVNDGLIFLSMSQKSSSGGSTDLLICR